MLLSRWFLFMVSFRIMLNHTGRREIDKRNFCAVLSEMWYEIDILSRLRCRKACSKGASHYECVLNLQVKMWKKQAFLWCGNPQCSR
ncbi:hypothetical protein V144x_27510 [Gimesia aquarii]|uniref:Uncharacterized protein n=1 Tax=Gimesia aquarii TaxID=2527964 RepID=A0A517VW98_9PLAN|nr:hypothetical protein V144x_27510 [Gimesia aquarii]